MINLSFNQSGDVRVIKELKLVNTHLKWQLEQRSKTLMSHKIEINDLQSRLIETQTQLAQISKERDELRSKM